MFFTFYIIKCITIKSNGIMSGKVIFHFCLSTNKFENVLDLKDEHSKIFQNLGTHNALNLGGSS